MNNKENGKETPCKKKVEPPTEEEISRFYGVLNGAKKKPAILKLIQPYVTRHRKIGHNAADSIIDV